MVEEDVLPEEVPVEEESTEDTTVVDVGGSFTPISKVVLGVTSLIEEYVVVAEEAGDEVVDVVKVVVVGVLI